MQSEKRKQADKRYRTKHSKRIKESKQLVYENNKDKILEVNKQYYLDNRESIIEYKRDFNIKKYGITSVQYNEIFNIQKGNCAICGKHQSTFKKRLFIDHDHITGRIRGLLCGKCNTVLGYVNDDTEILEKAIIYLKKYE